MTKKQYAAIKRIFKLNAGDPKGNLDKYLGYFDDAAGRHCVVNPYMGIRWHGDVGEIPPAPDGERMNFENTLKEAFDKCEKIYELPSLAFLKAKFKEVKKPNYRVMFVPPNDDDPRVDMGYLITMLEAMPAGINVTCGAYYVPICFNTFDDMMPDGSWNVEGCLCPVRDDSVTRQGYIVYEWDGSES